MGVFSFFGMDNKIGYEKKEYEKKIKELEEKLELKEKEITNLLSELDKVSKITPKQIQIFEKNINENREKAMKYKKILTSYKIETERTFYKYKVDINEFYPKKKFPNVAEKLIETGTLYVEDLSEVRLDSLFEFENEKNLEEIKKRFSEYKIGKSDWDIITLMNKGDKIVKIYSKLRKLLNIFSTLSLEYMDDIRDFDFNLLKLHNFSSSQIEEYKMRRDNYFNERAIKEE